MLGRILINSDRTCAFYMTVCFSSLRRLCVAQLALPKCCAQSSAVPCDGDRNGKWSEGHSTPRQEIIQNHMEPQRLPCKAPAPGTEVASSNDGSNLGTSTLSQLVSAVWGAIFLLILIGSKCNAKKQESVLQTVIIII